MKATDFTVEIRLSYAAHQRLLRLDFAADHIYTGVNHGRVVVALHLPGCDPFNIICCKTSLTYEQYAKAWGDFIEAVQVSKTVPQAELNVMYEEWPYSDTQLVVALLEKGLLPHQRTAVS